MSTITIDTEGLLSVTTGANESHIVQAPLGGKWTVAADGTTLAMTVTDGASGTPETYVLTDSNNTAWQLTVDDNGLLTLTAYDLLVALAPVVNAPVLINEVPASTYLLYTYQAGTTTPATTYKNGATIQSQPNPITLNAYGLPTDPVFITIGQYYKFVLLAPGGGSPVYTFDNISSGVPVNITTPTEWVSPSVSCTYLSPTSFTLPGDARATFRAGRRVQTNGSSTLVGTMTASTYDGTLTTVTVSLDSGALDNSLTTTTYALLNPGSGPIPDRRSVGSSTVFGGNLTVPTAQGLNLLPAGALDLHVSPPSSGWLACDGASYLRASYPNLFAAIGTTFGAADGTHFNVPTIASGVASLIYCIYAQV
jgi:hypothetical protein